MIHATLSLTFFLHEAIMRWQQSHNTTRSNSIELCYNHNAVSTFHGIEVSCSLFLDVILSFHCYSGNKAKTKRDIFSSYFISNHFGSLTYIVLTFFYDFDNIHAKKAKWWFKVIWLHQRGMVDFGYKSHDVAPKFGTPKHQTSIDNVEQNKFPQVVWLQ